MNGPKPPPCSFESHKDRIVAALETEVNCLCDVAKLAGNAAAALTQSDSNHTFTSTVDGLLRMEKRARELMDRFGQTIGFVQAMQAMDTGALYAELHEPVEAMRAINWDTHTLNFEFNLGMARLPRDSRADYGATTADFGELNRLLTYGQMQIDGRLQDIVAEISADAQIQERSEIGLYHKVLEMFARHGQLLGSYTQAECEKTLIDAMNGERHMIDGLSRQVGSATGRLQSFVDEACATGRVDTVAISVIAERFRSISTDLWHLAGRIGEPGDPLSYIAGEYGFFAENMSGLTAV